VLGSAFVDERDTIAGIGPVTVDPEVQDDGIGRALMEAALKRERDRRTVGVRLVQTAYHYRSLALYAKLGFVVREPLSVVDGLPPAISTPGRGVRPAHEGDLATCGQLCVRVHGHDRNRELHDAILAGTARVVERPGGISGYATGFGYGWHAVAETNEDLIALLASAEAFMGLGILVPSRNAELVRWCLEHGLRIVQQSTLMTIGLYNEPAGAYLPSIAY
jgi:GNAT superfamily N-acetyltransferase